MPANISKIDIRKTVLLRDAAIDADGHETVRGAAIIVLRNSLIGAENLKDFDPWGEELGSLVMDQLVAMLPSPVCSYGKAAVVGQLGSLEHGAALMHPSLGKPIRNALGGGKAIIPSNVKIGLMGATIDVPLSHKDDAWLFDYLDTFSITLPDAPKNDEIALIIVMSTGKRFGAGSSKRSA